MEKFDVKLVALDLDDTLLDRNALISDENVAALRECPAAGYTLFFVRGGLRLESSRS